MAKTNQQRKYARYHRLKNSGLCPRCGKEKTPQDTHIYCEECRKRMAKKQSLYLNKEGNRDKKRVAEAKRREEKRKQATQKVSPKKNNKFDNRERYLFFKNQGLCPRCHKEDVEPGKHLCKRCLLDHASYQTERFYQLKEQNRCVKCGVPIEKGTRCNVCRKKEVEHYHALHNMRVSQGLCPTCGGVRIDKTRVRCEKCREKSAKNQFLRKNAA